MISKYFAPLSMDGLRDDAAVLDVPEGHELVVSSDTLNEGVHFWPGEAPDNIARKALRVNLSDLAAKGAQPLAYQLNIAFPNAPDEAWIQVFTDALREDQERFGIKLSGGDTTSIKGALSISITVMGLVPKGRAVRRFGAKAGDVLVCTGTVGDAFVGLESLRGNIALQNPAPFLAAYQAPIPACDIAEDVQVYANASLDVSDGLIADIGHIARASGLRAIVNVGDVPLSDDARTLVEHGDVALNSLIVGGDDYVLVCAVSPENVDDFMRAVREKGFDPAFIGQLDIGEGVSVLDQSDQNIDLKQTGWSHF